METRGQLPIPENMSEAKFIACAVELQTAEGETARLAWSLRPPVVLVAGDSLTLTITLDATKVERED